MTMQKPNIYDLLGVGPDASAMEIEHAIRQAEQRWDPGSNSSPLAQEIMDFLVQARQVLTDTESRSTYDLSLQGQRDFASGQKPAAKPKRSPRPRPERDPASANLTWQDTIDDAS